MNSVNDKKLTSLCSSKTVQSEEQGFFSEFYASVLDACGNDWIENDFKNLKTDREKFLSLFDDTNVNGIVLGTLEHVKPVYKNKDAKVSMQRRLNGDQLFQNGELRGALLMYNVAVIRAPSPGTI